MEENYLISVTGIQCIDGETEKTELITSGDYVTRNNHRYIRYIEYDNDNPKTSTETTVKVEGNDKVTIIRSGKPTSRLVLEKGRRHQCHYNTAMGELMIGVFTDTIYQSLSDRGGDIRVSYQLDFFSDLVSSNEFHINVKKKEVQECSTQHKTP